MEKLRVPGLLERRLLEDSSIWCPVTRARPLENGCRVPQQLPSNQEGSRQPAGAGRAQRRGPAAAPEVTRCPAGCAEVEMAELYVKPGERACRRGALGPLPRPGVVTVRGADPPVPLGSPHTCCPIRRQQGARLERPAAVLLRAADTGRRTQAHSADQEGRRSPGWSPQRCVGAQGAKTGRQWAVPGISLSRGSSLLL